MTIILAINAGSSSVKVSVYKAADSSSQDPRQLADAEISGLSAAPASLKYTRGSEKVKGQELKEVDDQQKAWKYILDHLLNDDGLPELKHKDDIKYACHRIVHGGEYKKVQIINKSTFHHLEELSDLAPLHNAVGLAIVKAVAEELPKATNMAYFDSMYHVTMPEHIHTYAIDPEIAKKNKLRKYGFHGISYSFIIKAVAKQLGKEVNQTSIIALHLGSGASACAIQDGKSLDTSMGLTPLAGLPGGSRSGDVDPSLIFHYTHSAGKQSSSSSKSLHISQAEEILNKKSGFKAMTGTSDFGKIAGSDDPKCKLVFDLFVDRVVNFIGSYYVKLGGRVDALVFAGGIGEKGASFRAEVVKRCQCIGFEIDPNANEKPEDEIVASIGTAGARHKTLICQTDEQLEMARGCVAESKAA